MALIKDPKLDPNKMIESADYQVKARDFINNYGGQYGINNDMIGWNQKSGQITLGGEDFFKPDKVVNGSSWASNDALRGAVDNYAKQRGITSNKYTPEANGYNKDVYSAKIDEILGSITNAKPFSYDPNTDQSFKAYQQQYDRAGNNALANTMSEASALTGGRLNTWAVSAGNQAKANYDQQLMDVIPQLEQQAYGRYVGDLDMKRNNLNTLLDIDNDAYRKAIDSRDFAYGQDMDTQGRNDQLGRYAIEDSRYSDETAYARKQDAISLSDKRKNDAADNARAWASNELSRERFEYEKSMDQKAELEKQNQKKIDDELKKEEVKKKKDMALLYGAMINSGDAKAWLESHAANGDLSSEQLEFLYAKMQDWEKSKYND